MLELKPGDCFVVKTDSWAAGAINWGQALWSQDNRAEFNHAGIVVSADGTTFESLKRIGHYSLGQYAGSRILIVRYEEMTPERFWFGYGQVKRYDGRIYPFWRLPLHLINAAKFIHWSFPVCSELMGRFLNASGITPNTGWGTTPDGWADLECLWGRVFQHARLLWSPHSKPRSLPKRRIFIFQEEFCPQSAIPKRPHRPTKRIFPPNSSSPCIIARSGGGIRRCAIIVSH